MPKMSAHPGFSGPAVPGAGGTGEQKEEGADETREVLTMAGLAGPREEGVGPGEAAGEGCAPTEEVAGQPCVQPETGANGGCTPETTAADEGPARPDAVPLDPGEEPVGPGLGADERGGGQADHGVACYGENGEALLAAARDVPAGGLTGTGRARGLLGVDIGSHWLKIVQA
ncbi:MAG: hypothetical protein AB1816_21175, partial [Bacillota bacterium]